MYEKDVRIIHGVHNPVKLIFGHVPDPLSINDRFRTVAGEVAPVLIAGIRG
jgi:predicted ATP-grasp superfamily ATP-dependent carboligase